MPHFIATLNMLLSHNFVLLFLTEMLETETNMFVCFFLLLITVCSSQTPKVKRTFLVEDTFQKTMQETTLLKMKKHTHFYMHEKSDIALFVS